ncbi:LysR family transcriptional regulator [Paracoccus aurantiacus]|uniref:LysR family transcriptional regulator n=1 Tax=Paracoccus aurantiacus TaxID=2599412 RepID=A0A5C6RU73_9RHOB|nr:LysR family transcriptional regulator [Paracoccus aurantiacus]TXB65657.1 LysR family transcriptional regulator [Paracoccus aurantiacus]
MPRRAFNDLYAFTAVAEERSFTRAAARLGISQSTLSQTVRNLEEVLDVRLLTRSTRSVALTEAGAQLLETLGPGFAQMENALDALGDLTDRPRGTIRISAGEHAAVSVLQPGLSRFLAEYPDIRVEIAVSNALIDIVADGLDAGVRMGDTLAQDMIAMRISPDIRFAIAASPEYLKGRSAVSAPQDLTQHRCIMTRMPTHGDILVWELERGTQEARVKIEGPLVVSTIALRVNAALDGVGIVFMPEDQLEPHISAGRLRPVLKDWWPTYEGYHLYYPSRRQPTPAFRLLLEALRWRG